MNKIAPSLSQELHALYLSEVSFAEKYKDMRALLESIVRTATSNQEIQFPDLYSRLTYATELFNFSPSEKYAIQTMRKHAHLVMLKKLEPTNEIFLKDFSALVNAISKITATPIDAELKSIIQKYQLIDYKEETTKSHQAHHSKIRFYVHKVEPNIFHGSAEEISINDLQVVFDAKTSPFSKSLSLVKPGQVIHLIDCEVINNEIHPQLYIIEPDFLIDISAIAECFKSYGTHPYNYFINRLKPKQITAPILIGNMANHFLDIFVNHPKDHPIDFKESMQEIFQTYPFEISVNTELDDPEVRAKFFDESERQFEHIKYVVRNVFSEQNIDVENAVLEPSFLCSQLGIQGRLDFLSIQKDNSVVIELKSGKAPFPDTRTDLIGENHRTQLFLYQIVIQKVLGIPFKNIHSYLLYSKYNNPASNLRMVQPYMDGIKEILNIRNQIATIERNSSEDENYFERIVQHISPNILINIGGQNERFLNNYILPQIEAFKAPFNNASALEKAYFYSFYHFISKELFITKSGVSHYDQSLGHAGIWLSDIDAKIESGKILIQLKIIENNSDQTPPTIRLQIPDYEDSFLPNFRKGDIAILYQRDTPEDNVTNKQIHRGSIIEINHQEVTILLRNKQNNTLFLPIDSYYAIEHDFMEASFGSMFRGLYSFLMANQDRKDLLLNQRALEINEDVILNKKLPSPYLKEIIIKAKQAKDYFLLIGPPGTGKTSIALKAMVEEFYQDENSNILLLSYTNRAVDEICESISQIQPEIDFIRIGSEHSTDERFQHRLLKNVIQNHTKRDQVKATLEQCRVFVGTVASISGKSALFQMKKFDVAIIDEASQILEPQLMGILTAKHISNANAIQKFIMIGDHKQLPAIVVQSPPSSLVDNELLLDIGITDRRISLFERLYRYHQNDSNSMHWFMLTKQGRMHSEIAAFANQEFYNNDLETVPVAHQNEPLKWEIKDGTCLIQKIISEERLTFIASKKIAEDKSFKTNSLEAIITSTLLKTIFNLHQENNIAFSPLKSVGIITPYRSQIALIKKKIQQLQIPELNEVTIDTVERYQGSQRDIIIYSFCVNHASQLQLLSNTFVENEQLIDRKLNVALTRARKQIFITGNPYFLQENTVFNKLLQHVKENGLFLEEHEFNTVKSDN